jgi:hypothetical protein
MIAEPSTAQLVKILALSNAEIARHEHMIEPPLLPACHVGDNHGSQYA